MDANQTDHPTTSARANLSELISAVRLLRRTYFLTTRDKRQVALVPVELGELIDQAGGPDAAAEILAAHQEGRQ
jgi:hypothetical protein